MTNRTSEQAALALINDFVSKVNDLPRKIDIKGPMTIASSRDLQPPPFYRKPGVYLFFKDGDVMYVGCTTKSLGDRVWAQIAAGDREESLEWAQIIKNDATTLLLVGLQDDEYYWGGALEQFLIKKIGPRFNERNF